MTKQFQMTAEVQRGVAVLDKHIPDWFTVIDIDVLDLNDGNNCILGQLAQHPEVFTAHQRRVMQQDQIEGFCKVVHVLERTGGPSVVNIFKFGFIDSGGLDENGKYCWGMNNRSWIKAIEDREAAWVHRQAEYRKAMDATPLALEVKAAIDAEVEKLRQERMDAELRNMLSTTFVPNLHYVLLDHTHEL